MQERPDGIDAEDVLGHAEAWCAAGRGVALATVVSTWGSAPRPAGSLLVVSDAGGFFGSVSGGCVEGAVIEQAQEVIATGEVRRLRFGVTQEMAWEVGLACGGEIEVFVERVAAGRGSFAGLLEAKRAKRPVVLATDLGSGEQWLLDPEAGRAPAGLGDETLAKARTALRADRPARTRDAGRDVFLNVFNPPLRMIVVGAVHVAQSLARIATLAGFDVTVVDPREAFAAGMRFPGVAVSKQWPDEGVAALAPDARTAIVTLSHDPKLDDPALGVALRSEAFYVGALGSRKTHAKRLDRLREAGFDERQLARIRGPVGLAIGARSPAEISISIVAEAIDRLRRDA